MALKRLKSLKDKLQEISVAKKKETKKVTKKKS